MDVAALSDRTPAVALAAKAAGPAPRKDAAAATPLSQTGDSVALSDVAQSLSGGAREIFAAFSGEDHARLARMVESGAISAGELGDGLTSALKGSRKLQLWQRVFDTINEPGAGAEFEAERAKRGAAQGEIEKLEAESARLLKEMVGFAGKPQLAALSQKKAAEMQELRERMYALRAGELMDLTRPTTFVGTSGAFLSANWQTAAERSAQDKLEKLGVFSASVKDAIAAAGKKAAQENMIVRQIN